MSLKLNKCNKKPPELNWSPKGVDSSARAGAEATEERKGVSTVSGETKWLWHRGEAEFL